MIRKHHKKARAIEVGWSEWCALPDLGAEYIKAKIDTGAKTSSLHAYEIERIRKNGIDYVKFDIHPVQSNDKIVLTKKARIIDQRHVMSSNGHKEMRYVISTTLSMSDLEWNIELTLSNRDPLRYRLLLGREALAGKVIIHPGKKSMLGTVNGSSVLKYYRDY